MKAICFSFLALMLACSSPNTEQRVNASILVKSSTLSHPLDSSELEALMTMDQFNYLESVPRWSLSKIDLEFGQDSCLILIKEAITINATDTTVYLLDICEPVVHCQLAATVSYADGGSTTHSTIDGHQIKTTTIANYLGAFISEKSYEKIIDSILTVRTIQGRQIITLSKDTIRKMEVVDL